MNWIKSEFLLPPAGTPVIVFGKNEYGKGRTLRAFYAPRHTIEDDNDYEAAQYCEEKDKYYLKEGWYESNEFEDVHWRIEFEVTHWMSLPKPPTD